MQDDDIDLRELLSVIWDGKWIIIAVMVLFSIVGVYFAVTLPNIYRAEALIAPVEQESSLGGIQGQLGGLASLAGISLGGGSSNNTKLALEILKSRHFASSFIQKHDALPDLVASKSWDSEQNSIVYDSEIFDKTKYKWIRHIESNRSPVPTIQEAFKFYRKSIFIGENDETGMITLSVEHISPYVAKQWVDWLIEDINYTMKLRDVEEAEKSTEFLTMQLEQTQIADIRDVLYRLVEEQAKTIMFANVRDEYVFKTIDPALVPEEKAKPKRALIVVLGSILGSILGLIIVIIKRFFK
jgi:uncharacterized protein involved in exopolysaccharide biosynthesis